MAAVEPRSVPRLWALFCSLPCGWTCTFLSRGRLVSVPGWAGVTDGCWSKSGLFPVSLSFTSSLSPHNNPAAVLMVTLSTKSEGIGFLQDTRSQYCTSGGLSALTISPAPSSFFLSLLNVSFLPPHRPRSLCLLYLTPPLITSSVITACWVNSPPFFLQFFFHHREIPTMTGLYQLPCINLTQSNLWHLLCYCSSFLCFSVSTNGLPPLYHVLQAVLIVLSLMVSALDVISLTLK